MCGPNNDIICGTCLSVKIDNWFLDIQKTNLAHQDIKIGECDACGEGNVLVATIIWDPAVDLRFGVKWWNGHWVCRKCLSDCARKGHVSTGQLVFSKNSSHFINEVGAMIKEIFI